MAAVRIPRGGGRRRGWAGGGGGGTWRCGQPKAVPTRVPGSPPPYDTLTRDIDAGLTAVVLALARPIENVVHIASASASRAPAAYPAAIRWRVRSGRLASRPYVVVAVNATITSG